jgi:hypothetical protein
LWPGNKYVSCLLVGQEGGAGKESKRKEKKKKKKHFVLCRINFVSICLSRGFHFHLLHLPFPPPPAPPKKAKKILICDSFLHIPLSFQEHTCLRI